MPRVQGLFPLQYVVQQTRFATAKGKAPGSTTIQECPEGNSALSRTKPAPLSNNFRWSNGVKELVYACPDALHEPDPVQSCCPL
jgi:hypothetical protein